MRKAKGLGVTAAFVIWISLIAYPGSPLASRSSRAPPTEQTLNQPGLFFPLLGARSLPIADGRTFAAKTMSDPALAAEPGQVTHGATGRTGR